MIKETIIEMMNTVDLQPLQYLAAVRVAICVCQSEDVQLMIGRFRKTIGKDGNVGFLDGQWKRLRGKVKRELKKGGVPGLIVDVVLDSLWPVSFQIFEWIVYHDKDTGIDFSPNYYWTPQINIDHAKTAKLLVKNESIEIENRFKLACFYCFDSDVRSLWEQMSLSERRSYRVPENLKKSDQNPIVLYWTCYIQDAPKELFDSKVLKPSQLFKYAVENRYLSAAKFFVGQMKANYRNRTITNSFYNHLRKLYYPNCILKDQLAITCFLICQMRRNTWENTYFRMLGTIFFCFLEWPMQKHFLNVVNRLKHLLTSRIFGILLEGIFERDMRGFRDYDYKELFKEFWRQSPEMYRTHVNTEWKVGFDIFMKFVKKHFGFVFEEKSFALKAKFRAVVFQREISEDVTEKEHVEFFKFLVRERVTTKSSIHTFSTRRPPFSMRVIEYPFLNIPLGELMYLIDGILGIE